MPSRLLVRALLAGAGAALAALLLFFLIHSPPDPVPPSNFDPSTVATEQTELDAPFVATEVEVVEAMLKLADVEPGDYVLDLGSGDGRILIAAAKEHGARGLGVDIDPARIRDSRYNAEAAGVADRVEFVREDLFNTPLGKADVLTLYLSPEINQRLRPRILEQMRPGARVVSHAFDMGDWAFDARDRVGNANVYMWTVPARVGGRWLLRSAGGTAELDLKQRFQELSGSYQVGGRARPIEHGRVRGELVEFVADLGGGRRVFLGRLEDGRLVPAGGGTATAVSLPRATGWRAERPG